MLKKTTSYAFGVALVVTGAIAIPALAKDLPVYDETRGVMTMAPLLERATPAVVNISVQVSGPDQENPLMRDPFFRRFFGVPPGQGPRRGSVSAGSGVIVDAEQGHVMTNHHVIKNAEKVMVTLKDRRRLRAELVGSDPETDIAVLKIEADNLVALPFADSGTLRVGDLAIAIGNPFGLGQTVTSGIVSALGRGIGMHGYEDFIQTDAPINPGNSGGALVNSKGELIGVNSAIIGPSGGNVGIGFAVPSNMARAVMGQLIEFGEVRRGRLGVRIQDLSPEIAEALGLDVEQGAVITSVEEGAPAENAGLMAGDVVVAVDGEVVRNASDLRNKVGLARRGTKVRLSYIRDGKAKDVSVEVTSAITIAEGQAAAPQLTGAVFRDISPDLPMHGKVEGVLVADVARGSPAWRSGLKPGDVILAVNRKPVKSIGQLTQAVRQSGPAMAFNFLRNGTALFLVIQ